MTNQEARDETPEQIADRYVAAFMGDGPRATVYRDRLVEMVANVATEAAEFRKHQEPAVTDDQVEAAARVIYDMDVDGIWTWDDLIDPPNSFWWKQARAALEAALVPGGEGSQR